MNSFNIDYSDLAKDQLNNLIGDPSKKSAAKAVVKSLEYMGVNIRHPSLNTHKYDDMTGPKGEDVFESYAQNKTPGAYRIFWFYGPGKLVITILAITPHP
jgi:hypothetical protein